MQTFTVSQLFLDGIASITATCFQFLIPIIFLFVVFLSWEKIISKDDGFGKKLLFLAGITILMLDGVYLVYLLLSYPRSDLAQLYLSYRKEIGIFLGVILLAFYGLRLLKPQNEKLFSSCSPFVTAALIGLVITSAWAPCIRETVASISQHESGRLPFLFFYIAGITLPFLLLSLVAFGLKFLSVTGESVRKFSTIGIILLILLSLTKLVMK